MLPETLCLADYGLGHDDRAQEHQSVASVLGPRFLDWQLAQTPEESWAECERHARALAVESARERAVDGADVKHPLRLRLTDFPARTAYSGEGER